MYHPALLSHLQGSVYLEGELQIAPGGLVLRFLPRIGEIRFQISRTFQSVCYHGGPALNYGDYDCRQVTSNDGPCG